MAQRLLSIGFVQSIAQNEIVSLPARRVLFSTDAAAPTIQTANDVAFALPVAITLTNGQAELAAAFLRVTSAGPINVRLVAV